MFLNIPSLCNSVLQASLYDLYTYKSNGMHAYNHVMINKACFKQVSRQMELFQYRLAHALSMLPGTCIMDIANMGGFFFISVVQWLLLSKCRQGVYLLYQPDCAYCYFDHLLLVSADVNECLVDNGGCVDVCNNIDGSYQCACNNGYEFESLSEGTEPSSTNAGRTCIGTYHDHDIISTVHFPY